MPIVPFYPRGEVSPRPLPDVAPSVPAAGDPALFGADRARDLQVAGQQLTEPPSNDPDFNKAIKTWPGAPVILPNGSHIENPKSPTGYVMAPFPGLESVVKAARRARSEVLAAAAISPTAAPLVVVEMMYEALHRNVDHGGDFDYQRQANNDQKGGFVQLRQFRNVSNVNVGLFCQQVGLPREMALTISGLFAVLFSSNRDIGAPYFLDKDTKKYIDIGYDLGEKGVFDRACFRSPSATSPGFSCHPQGHNDRSENDNKQGRQRPSIDKKRDAAVPCINIHGKRTQE